MSIEAKISNPISIRIGKNTNIVLADQAYDYNLPLIPGVMIGNNHYGFILITDYNGKQKEVVYPTQNTIQAIGIENGVLKVFENGKKSSWTFDKKGTMQHSAFDDFTKEYQDKVDRIIEHYDMFMGEPKIENPIHIKVYRNPEESIIKIKEQMYPLHPGVLLGTIHYGFIMTIETETGEKEIVYPTQNRIDAAGIEISICGDIKIFENGKYHPWTFSYEGIFKSSASYNEYSRKDKEFVTECYDLNEKESEDRFILSKKK